MRELPHFALLVCVVVQHELIEQKERGFRVEREPEPSHHLWKDADKLDGTVTRVPEVDVRIEALCEVAI
jgi:hypothetical protein